MLQTSEASERIQVAFEIIDLDRHGEIGSADIRRALQLLVRCTGGGVKSKQRSEAEAFKGVAKDQGQRRSFGPLPRLCGESEPTDAEIQAREAGTTEIHRTKGRPLRC